MRIPSNLHGFHNSHDGVIPQLISIIETLSDEINRLRMQVNIMGGKVDGLDENFTKLVDGMTAALQRDE